ncbi:putative reverse transcriptase [Arabidopsis thaliana]|uniref:Putative reverse transcriptase n=1 Tax=Arabidopsis thaliana TaxID=3702 RepID=Q9ZT80_ARATH|nr:putative reverse transcriptase [Arabidopsis thaliana]AAD15309.1 putative reverse transcriptase [Arabidopsis thaliana]CAB77838.1 putative reverse transcriptase [Arabidopsis thaliana]
MGKRNGKSVRRSSSPDLLVIASSKIHEQSSGSSARAPGSSIHAAIHQPAQYSSSRHFEVSDSPDNSHSPYHLVSSDHPGLVLAPELLDGNSYGTWIIAMTTSIEAKNKLGFVDGSIPKPDDDDPYCKIWRRCNSMVKSWLLNSVSKEIYTSILYFPTAAAIWKDLYTRFHKSSLPRLYKLRQQIHSLRQGNLDLSSYHTRKQTLWEELTSLQAIPRTVEDLLIERETNRVIDFLMGLNDCYDAVRSQILMKKTLPSLSEVFNMIDQDEIQRSARISTTPGMTSSVFAVSNQSSQSVLNGDTYQKKERPVCTYCSRPGHVEDTCYKKHGYPTSFKSKQIANTELQIVDPFTKLLYPSHFQRLISKMGLLNIFVPS